MTIHKENSVGNYFPIGHTFGEFQTQEELDFEYDVERAVIDFPKYIELFQSKSAKTRAEIPVYDNLQYGQTLMERLNIFPSEQPNSPVIIFIHGGYWKAGVGDDYDFVTTSLHKAGFTVVVISYGLAPNITISEMISQIRAAISYTSKNCDDFNGDRHRLYIAGHSAGAHLAMMAAFTDWKQYDLNEKTIKGILAISGLYDLEPVSQTFIQPTVRITAEQILHASPIRLINNSHIPIIVSWGGLETKAFQNQSSNFFESWIKAGNKGKQLIVEEAHHFNILEEFSDDGLFTKAIIELALNN